MRSVVKRDAEVVFREHRSRTREVFERGDETSGALLARREVEKRADGVLQAKALGERRARSTEIAARHRILAVRIERFGALALRRGLGA